MKIRDITLGGIVGGVLVFAAMQAASHPGALAQAPQSVTPAATGGNSDARPPLDPASRGCFSCPGDLNGDNAVNTQDLTILLQNFGNFCQPDTDSDGVPNQVDNCPNTPNANQSDLDADATGDVCDNCPTISNPGQQDTDNDGIGNACDNCPTTPNPGQQDTDSDGIGDACDTTFNCTTAAQCPPGPPNTVTVCQGGNCTYPCSVGFADCNSTMSDGCEVAIVFDPGNCGGCGNICPPNPPDANYQCINGACTFVCNSGFTNCAGVCRNLLTDANNCGACGVVCSFPNATSTCVNGICTIGACNTGFANCDTIAANGCEVNILTSTQNCGSCGLICSLPNATATCVNGQCQVGSCNVGFANCDNVTANGCEVNILNNSQNCGACGVVCPSVANATVGCQNGNCTIVGCNTGFRNCDNIFANGCETNILTSVNNCGNCNVVCVPGPRVTSVACVNGTCKITGCQSGWADQDGIFSNGCEFIP